MASRPKQFKESLKSGASLIEIGDPPSLFEVEVYVSATEFFGFSRVSPNPYGGEPNYIIGESARVWDV